MHARLVHGHDQAQQEIINDEYVTRKDRRGKGYYVRVSKRFIFSVETIHGK